MGHQDALGGKGRRLQSRSLCVFTGVFTHQLGWRSATLPKSSVIPSNWPVSTLALIPPSYPKEGSNGPKAEEWYLPIIPVLKRMRQEDG